MVRVTHPNSPSSWRFQTPRVNSQSGFGQPTPAKRSTAAQATRRSHRLLWITLRRLRLAHGMAFLDPDLLRERETNDHKEPNMRPSRTARDPVPSGQTRSSGGCCERGPIFTRKRATRNVNAVWGLSFRLLDASQASTCWPHQSPKPGTGSSVADSRTGYGTMIVMHEHVTELFRQ